MFIQWQTFKSISTFEAHYRSHLDEHPYACDYRSCSEDFHDLGALQRHQRTHPIERPFVCKYESCGQAFHVSKVLDQHHQTHTEQFLFTCKYDSCGQVFHERGELTDHHRTHKQRPLACEYDSCSRTFAQRESLEAHMHMHTRARPYPCSYEACNKSFCDRGDLLQHEKNHPEKHTLPRSDKSFHETFAKPLHLHGPYREDEEATKAVEMVRPIRLRLSQPKRQNPGSLENSPRKRILLRLSMGKTLGTLTASDPKQARETCSESNASAQCSAHCIDKSKVHQEAHLPNSSLSTSSISEASTGYQIPSQSFNFTSRAMPRIPTPNVDPQAPAVHTAVNSVSAEKSLDKPCTDGESSGYGASVYTKVCGVHSREIAFPDKVENKAGPFHCPRCDTLFTRARGVRRHFVGCITRYGNPHSLKWTDHPSLQKIVLFYARNGFEGRQYDLTFQAAKVPSHLPQDDMLLCLIPKSLSAIGKESTGNVKSTSSLTRRNILLPKNIVQPIRKRLDALRRSKYSPETIARDILLATGSHPSMDPLNAHLDILMQRFPNVKPESNMGTFRWDLVDPMQNSKQNCNKEPEKEPRREHELEHGSEKHEEEEIEPEQSTTYLSKARKDTVKSQFNRGQWHYGFPFSLPSRTSMRTGVPDIEVPFTVTLPGEAQFGPMSTIFSHVFDRDPSARLMSGNENLWAAIFTMLEHRYHRPNFITRTAVERHTGDVMGWVACHDVDTLQAVPGDPLAYLDWTTAAHLLPPQTSLITSTEECKEEKTERSEVDCGLASTIQAQATEAQTYLIPVRRLVINALVVHPSHQGRGVASALLEHITKMADMDHRPIWIQAPVAQGSLKAGLFWRAGFTCVGELNLDLDCFASQKRERGEGENVRFGRYKWNYMLRW